MIGLSLADGRPLARRGPAMKHQHLGPATPLPVSRLIFAASARFPPGKTETGFDVYPNDGCRVRRPAGRRGIAESVSRGQASGGSLTRRSVNFLTRTRI